MFKKIFSLFAFCILSFTSFASEIKIVATVNNDIITSYDVAERVKLSSELLKINKYNFPKSEIEKRVLSEIIDDKIKMAEATKFGIRMTAEEFADATKRMEKYLNLPEGGYKKIAKDTDIDENVINKQIEADVIWMKFVYSVLRSYVKVSDNEVNLLIENMKNEKQFNYEISSLIANKSDLKKLMEKSKDISDCDSFVNFAKNNGQAGSGMKITLSEKQMDKKLHKLLASSKVKKATNPIELNGKETIFFICDKTAFTPIISDKKKEEIKFNILQNKLDAFANKYFEKIKASSVIDIKG